MQLIQKKAYDDELCRRAKRYRVCHTFSMAEFDGRKYEFVFATDAVNDGVCLEAWQEEEPKELVLFAFRSWVDDSFTFTAYQENLPFTLVEEFVHATRRNLLPPPKDGN